MRDEDIDCSDIPELDDTCWKNAILVHPANKERIIVLFDAVMVEWYRQQGLDYQTRMNTGLRGFHEAHKNEL